MNTVDVEESNEFFGVEVDEVPDYLGAGCRCRGEALAKRQGKLFVLVG